MLAVVSTGDTWSDVGGRAGFVARMFDAVFATGAACSPCTAGGGGGMDTLAAALRTKPPAPRAAPADVPAGTVRRPGEARQGQPSQATHTRRVVGLV